MKKFVLILLFSLALPLFASAALLPSGNYQRSCDACFQFQGRLSCLCKDRRGFPNHTTFNLHNHPRCTFIKNIDGRLSCTRHMKRHPRWRRRKFILRWFTPGPIWNQADAANKCYSLCRNRNGKWTGQWNTVRTGRRSLCQCKIRR